LTNVVREFLVANFHSILLGHYKCGHTLQARTVGSYHRENCGRMNFLFYVETSQPFKTSVEASHKL